MSEIAEMFGVSVNTIVWANNLKNVRDMRPGDMLVILPVSGIERTIVKGDTLKSLAKKYGADADEIVTFNGLDSDALLAIGTTIIIPGGELPVPTQQLSRSTSKPMRSPYTYSSVAFPGYFSNPIPGAILTQGIHDLNSVDLGAAHGAPIYAAAGGVVIIARGGGGWNGGYGNYVVITHDNGSQTIYGHMRSVIVAYGQSVSRGQLIGYVGSTGRSTGPHLHFEVRGAKNPFINCALRSVCSPE